MQVQRPETHGRGGREKRKFQLMDGPGPFLGRAGAMGVEWHEATTLGSCYWPVPLTGRPFPFLPFPTPRHSLTFWAAEESVGHLAPEHLPSLWVSAGFAQSQVPRACR